MFAYDLKRGVSIVSVSANQSDRTADAGFSNNAYVFDNQTAKPCSAGWQPICMESLGPSPLVFTAQGTLVFRWSEAGFAGVKFSAGGQLAVNGLSSPNGLWTGQGAVQFAPLIPSADKYTKFFGTRLDLGLPFVSAFIQRNKGQPVQSGFAVGLQPSIALIKGTGDDPILSAFINAQVAFAWSLDDGKGQPVSPQLATGLSLDLWQLLVGQKK